MSNWYPHLLEAHCKKEGLSAEFSNAINEYGNSLYLSNYPVIYSLKHLSELTDSNYRLLRNIIYRADDPYGHFKIRKRAGGYRDIQVPVPALLYTQRWIHNNILCMAPVHPSTKSYIKNCGIIENAQVHCGAKWLVKIDIQRFFESISERQVFRVYQSMGYTDLLAFELTRLSTRVTSNTKKYKSKRWTSKLPMDYKFYNFQNRIGHLPQGAPTSPMLSNLVLKPIDIKLSEMAKRFGCVYSRYSDDLAFSSYDFDRVQAKKLIAEISVLLSKHGFRRNVNKTRVIPPGARKIVTGLVVNGTKPAIQKELKHKIENHIYYSTKYSLQSHCERKGFISILGFKRHLYGLINFVSSVDPCLGKKYLDRSNKIKWPSF